MVYQLTDELSVYANYIEGLVKGDIAPASSGGVAVVNAGEALEPYVSEQTEVGIKYDGGSLGGSLALFTTERPFSTVENGVSPTAVNSATAASSCRCSVSRPTACACSAA